MTTAPRVAPEWTPPERPASETREQLLAAAEWLFAERGFGGVSVRMEDVIVATVNGGGPVIRVKTLNGTIKIAKGGG